MKNFKLNLKGLYGYSQSLSPRTLQPSDERETTERQPREERTLLAPVPQRFARYAAMLIMLLTLGVGQVLAYEYTVYVVPKMLFGNNWTEGSKKVKVWWKTNYSKDEHAEYMSKTSYTYGGDYIYEYKIYSLTGQGADQISFQRFSSSDSWEETYNAFTSYEGESTFSGKIYLGYQNSAHRWMTYCHDATYYFIKTGTSSSWAEAPNAHAWNAAQSTYATTTWPGNRMTDSGKTYKGKNIYSITFNNPPYSMVKFNNYSNSDNQSGEKSLPGNEGKIFDYEADNWLSYAYDHKVTFDGNGSTSGSMTDQTMPYNTATAIEANGFTKTGYTFTGWNTEADGSGTSYAAGANITVTDSDVKLYAQWTQTGYYIVGAFNSWNHPDSCRMTATETPNEVAVTLRFRAADFSPSYKTQIKVRDWSTSSGTWYGNNDRGSSKSINKAGNNPTTLTASNSDSYNMYLDLSISAGSYTFRYNTSTKVLTVDFPVNNRIDFFTPSTDYANMTLDGTVYSCSKELAANTTYTFKLEWLSDFYGNGSNFTGTNTIASLTSNTGDMTLKTTVAGEYQFSFNTSTKAFTVTYPTAYTVTYGMGTGGSSVSASAASAGGTFSSGALVRSGDEVTFTQTAATGYSFKGWYTTADGNITAGVDGDGHLTINAAKTVYAQYDPNDYVIALDKNTGSTDGSVTATYNSTATKDFTAVTKTGYDCTGYWTAESGGHKVVNANGTLVSYSSDVSAYLNSNGTWKKTDPTTLYAQWEAQTYTITLDDNGDYQSNGSATATYDSGLSGISLPSRTGYHVEGYYKESGCTNKIANADGTLCASTDYTDASSHWTSTSNQTLYTKWTANTYTVQFDPNDENYVGDATGSMADQGFTYDAAQALTTNGFTRAGYDFNGWNTNADGTSGTNYTDRQSVSNLTTENEGAVTLYAKWTAKNYVVTLNYGMGERGTNPATITVTMGATYASSSDLSSLENHLPTLADASGYYFTGWYTSPSGGTKITDETIVTTASAHTLYARFVEQSYVYFYNNLGWENVYVVFNAAWHQDNDGKSDGTGSDGTRVYAQMEQIGTTNIYRYLIPEYALKTNWQYNIAFNNTYLNNVYAFSSGQAVFRTDFDSYATMFVPNNSGTNTFHPDKIAGITYYSTAQWGDWSDHRHKDGYWKRYNSTEGGYTIKGSWDSWANDNYLKSVTTDGWTYAFSKYLDANTTYQFLLYKHCTTSNTATSTFTNTSGDAITGTTENIEFTTQYAASGSVRNSRITTTAAGEYVFTLTCGTDGTLKLSVKYPLTANQEYRVLYSWNDGSAHTHASEYIHAEPGTSKKISVFVHKSSAVTSRSLTIQKCTAIDGSGNPTWTDGNTIDLSSVGESGVYNFVITQPASGEPTGAYSEPYTGDYYIRTDAADGGWDFYKEIGDNKMRLSEYSLKQTIAPAYSHYYCKFIGNTTTNITYQIATDYSPCVSEVMIGDATIGDGVKTLPAKANVRFSWNSKTNALRRAYIKEAQGDNRTRFLVLQGTNNRIFNNDATGSVISADSLGMTGTELILADQGNWVYQVKLKAQPSSTYKLVAQYNGSDRYLIGEAAPATLMGGSGDNKYEVTAVYDFKSNRLMTAWTPSGDIVDKLENVDVMLVRNKQGAGTPITFGSGGSLEAKTMIGAIKLDYSDLFGKVASWSSDTRPKLKYMISFPFDVNVSDVFGLNGSLGEAYVIQKYNGAKRAQKGFFRGDGTTTFWENLTPDSVMHAYEGYCVIFDNEYLNGDKGRIWEHKGAGSSVYLYFPSAEPVGNVESSTRTINVPAHECKIDRTFTTSSAGGALREVNHKNTDSHWNLMGMPIFNNLTGDATLGTPGAVFVATGDTIEDFHYFYNWNSDNNKFSITAGAGHVFNSMHCYMVQYHGNVTFTGSRPASSVAARRAPAKEKYNIELQVLNSSETLLNRTYVELRENACDTFALNEDVYLSPNSNTVELYTYAGDYDVAANVLSIGNHTVPVGVDVYSAGTYTFSMPSDFSGTVTLVDSFAQTRTNLAVEDYTVDMEKGTFNDRFFLELDIQAVTTNLDQTSDGFTKDKTRKVMIDGILYIVKDGKMYDARGNKVK